MGPRVASVTPAAPCGLRACAVQRACQPCSVVDADSIGCPGDRIQYLLFACLSLVYPVACLPYARFTLHPSHPIPVPLHSVPFHSTPSHSIPAGGVFLVPWSRQPDRQRPHSALRLPHHRGHEVDRHAVDEEGGGRGKGMAALRSIRAALCVSV